MLEIERKYLVDSSKLDMLEVVKNADDIYFIEQHYTKLSFTEIIGRIRKQKKFSTLETEYFLTTKDFVSNGINEEDERTINKGAFLVHKLSSQSLVEKIRFPLFYNNLKFELDCFEGKLKGLTVMEIELSSLDQEIKLPPYIPVIKEITDDRRYSNYNLSLFGVP